MKHKIFIETHNEEEMDKVRGFIGTFDFQDIRPMAESLDIEDSISLIYGTHGRVLWVDTLLQKFPDAYNSLSDEYLLNMVVPNNGLSYNEVRMKYDKKVALGRKLVRTFPVIKPDDLLHPYGQESEDKSYLFGHKATIRCQADIIYLGKVTLENLVKYGAYHKSDWVEKNWGSDNSTDRQVLKVNSCCCTWNFETSLTIFPLLKYIDKYLEDIEMKIEYTYGTEDNMVTMVKPFDSSYYTEV